MTSSKKKIGGKLAEPQAKGCDTNSENGQKRMQDDVSSSGDNNFNRANTDQNALLGLVGISDSGTSYDTGNTFSVGGKQVTRPKMDWRQFFEGDELDKAYQIVEVEQRDETDSKGDESMGSNSDPSEDNFEEEQVYKDLYGINNPKDKMEKKKE